MNTNTLSTQYWRVRSDLAEATEAHYRDKIISKTRGLSPIEKIRLITFDGVAPKITPGDVLSLLEFLERKVDAGLFSGVGVEVGAGAGFFSAMLARLRAVQKIYAVEISKPIVEDLMPEIVHAFAKEEAHKIVPCVGDFSHMELPDESVDFIFDFFSLHHSDDLGVTFKEMARVLKKGGKIICLDKARADALSDTDLETLLDKEYSKEGKELMGLDPNIKWTRRMNGEREFRLKDWTAFAKGAGLKLEIFLHLMRIVGSNPMKSSLKKVISLLPITLETTATRLSGLSGKEHANSLETRASIFTDTINSFPKEISLMIFRR